MVEVESIERVMNKMALDFRVTSNALMTPVFDIFKGPIRWNSTSPLVVNGVVSHMSRQKALKPRSRTSTSFFGRRETSNIVHAKAKASN